MLSIATGAAGMANGLIGAAQCACWTARSAQLMQKSALHEPHSHCGKRNVLPQLAQV
jgi:hypothetical protein